MKKVLFFLIAFSVCYFMPTRALAQNEPEGTIIVALRNNPKLSDNIFRVAGIEVPLQMTAGNNLEGQYGNKWTFVSMGNRRGINGIQSIPDDGWADKVALQPRQGIIARYFKGYLSGVEQYEYVAIYVDGWIISSDGKGSVIGATIHYKADFTPHIGAVSKDLFYGVYSVSNQNLAKWYLRFADSNSNGIIERNEAENITVLGYDKYEGTVRGPEDIVRFEGLTAFRNLREMYINAYYGTFSKGIKTVFIKHPRLEKLYISSAEVPEIDLRECNNLRDVELEWFKTEVRVLLPSSVERVKVVNCKMTSLDISQCPKLKFLNVSHNRLTTLNLSNNTKLEMLSVWDNQLTSLDVSKLINLQELYCSKNKFTSLDLTHNPRLSKIGINGAGSLKRVILPANKSKRDYLTESGTVANFSGLNVVSKDQSSNTIANQSSPVAIKSGIYQIGDTIHFPGGSVGIVFSVSGGGRHGKAIEFGSRAANWLSKRLYDGHYSDGRSIPIENFWMYRTEATSDTNGKENTDKIVNAARRIEAKTGEKLGGHEFIKVLLESGMYEAGWYVPAIKELEELYTAIAQEKLMELISKWNYCAPFKQYYHSSTEIKDPEDKHLFTHYEAFSMINGNSFSIDKSFGKYAVRYIHAF